MLREHVSRKQWKFLLLIAGLILIAIGILIPVLCIADMYRDCSYRYLNDIDGFGSKYDSLWDCFITRSDTGAILSILAGMIPILSGCCLTRNR